MAMKHYQGVDGVARQVKKRYEGVEGISRRVKKAYTGVEGVARQYFSSGGLVLFDADAGGDNTDITGGWRIAVREGRRDGQLTVSKDKMYFSLAGGDGGQWSSMGVQTNKLIDLSPYSTIYIEGFATRSYASPTYPEVVIAGCTTNKNPSEYLDITVNQSVWWYETKNNELDVAWSLDFPDSPQYFAIGFADGMGGNTAYLTITKLYLE